MRFRSSVTKALAALVVFIPVLAAMSGASPTPKAAPHARRAGGHCTPVGGTIMTNLGAIDQNTTMGTATGDLRGAVGAKILNSDGVNITPRIDSCAPPMPTAALRLRCKR